MGKYIKSSVASNFPTSLNEAKILDNFYTELVPELDPQLEVENLP